jgi:hypothetical protein
MKKFVLLLLALPMWATASEKIALDRLPAAPDMQTSLQRGARNFVNHCLSSLQQAARHRPERTANQRQPHVLHR